MEKEWIEQTTGKECEFSYDGRKCKETKIYGISRCKCLCLVHFNTVRKDNVRRFNKEEDIPKELVFTKPLRTSDTFSRFAGILTEDERREEKDVN